MQFEFDSIKSKFGEFKHDFVKIQIEDAVKALNKLLLWEWIKTFEPNKGFSWSNDPNIQKMRIALGESGGHSTSSFACMLRHLQRVAKELIPNEIENCPICREVDNEDFVVFSCYHKYHKMCISKKNIKTCPLCRAQSVPFYL
jgi:hypothetical protein